MTPQLEAAIAAIQPLSPIERQQLLQILIQSTRLTNLHHIQNLNHQFWQGSEVGYLLATQTPKTVHNLKDIAADFWPEEDSTEDFLTFLRQQRQQAT